MTHPSASFDLAPLCRASRRDVYVTQYRKAVLKGIRHQILKVAITYSAFLGARPCQTAARSTACHCFTEETLQTCEVCKWLNSSSAATKISLATTNVLRASKPHSTGAGRRGSEEEELVSVFAAVSLTLGMELLTHGGRAAVRAAAVAAPMGQAG